MLVPVAIQLVQDLRYNAAKGIAVNCVGDAVVADQLGRHAIHQLGHPHLQESGACKGDLHVLVLQTARKAEVGDLRVTVLHQDVIQFDVAVDVVLGVDIRQAFGDLADDIALLLVGELGDIARHGSVRLLVLIGRLGGEVGQTAVSQLHHQHGEALGVLAHAVQAQAVGVVQGALDGDLAVQVDLLLGAKRLQPLLHGHLLASPLTTIQLQGPCLRD